MRRWDHYAGRSNGGGVGVGGGGRGLGGGGVCKVWRSLVHHAFIITGKCTAISGKFHQKLDLTVKHVGKTVSFVQIE
ncbi:hypothetical protein [Paenibacillus sp. Soil766]|uniref:hypothetical protein n=1 Tax=Paenibacillus sp. Soil766 TaxID=1736404 RepID=UPI000ADAA156|nr:hypothetical protein [Paenibacillus sp. Soil766]